MTDTPETVLDEFRDIADECERRGFVNGIDFMVEGVPASLSSELMILEFAEGQFEVRYSDMGRERVKFSGSDITVIREKFLEEVAWLAAGRGRGPYVGQPTREQLAGASRTMEEAVALFHERFGKMPDNSSNAQD